MPEPKKLTKFLIVRSDGECRITMRRPRLRWDEIAFQLNVTIPAGWGAIQADSLDLSMPEPPEAAAIHAVEMP